MNNNILDNVKIEYTLDGYKGIEEKITSFEQLESRLHELRKNLTVEKNGEGIKCIGTVDVAMENIGRISISLDEKCILLFYDEVTDIYYNPLM